MNLIHAKNINGYEMYLYKDEKYMTPETLGKGGWEKEITDFVKQNLKPGQTFVDVGACIGYYTLLANKLGANVKAFEPSSENYEVLEKNLKLNSANIGNILTSKVAISDKTGEADLYDLDEESQGERAIRENGNKHEKVMTIRLDKVLDKAPDMIKIDVEGHERQVLEGMGDLLQAEEMTIIIEDETKETVNWLKTLGYRQMVRNSKNPTYVMVKKPNRTPKKMRFHLLGAAHLPTNKHEALACAFSQKVLRMAQLLKGLGHEVIFYGVEGSEVECDEFVPVVSHKLWEEVYGRENQSKTYDYDENSVVYKVFNRETIKAINERKQDRDFLLITLGWPQKPIADAVNIPLTTEIGIGYPGPFAPYKIWESYAWMHHLYGRDKQENGIDYDAVIPGFFDPNDFEYCEDKEDYFLYLGRIIHRKGIAVAIEIAETLGKKLKVAGQLSEDVDLTSPNVEFVGFADLAKRKELMRKAKAILMPTLYLEPFGYVAIEAMFSGTPVITTDWGAFPETIQHGKTGYRCRTFDQFMWAAKNIDKIKPADCRKWAEDNYSIERVSKMFQEYFEQLQELFDWKGQFINTNRDNVDWLNKIY